MSWQPTTHVIRDLIAKHVRIRDNINTGPFKKIFIGDPMLIPQSYYPCVVVCEDEPTEISYGATGTDKISEGVTIKVIFNKMSDLGAPDDTNLTEEKLSAVIKGCDPVTGQWLPDTFMGILRSNQMLGGDGTTNWYLSSKIKIKMYNDDRSVKGETTMTQEAHIMLSVTSDKVVIR